MSRTAATSCDLFAEHYVDLRAEGAAAHVAAGLRERGLVTLDGLDSRAAVLELAARYLDVAPHRDSDPDGLTVIHNTHQHTSRPGFAGLGSGSLAPHTERSGTPFPPRLMLVACARPAEEGGANLLTDGHKVYADLALSHPDAVEALSEDSAGFFGGQDGVLAPVFRHTCDQRVTVRLRLDELVRWHPLVTRHIRALTEALARHQQPLLLDAGDAFLLDNSRWLHARTAFTGPRRLYRALGNPHYPLPEGSAARALGQKAVSVLEKA
jgi:alpha-ketoglutarate-dependent taurine dioxygenase